MHTGAEHVHCQHRTPVPPAAHAEELVLAQHVGQPLHLGGVLHQQQRVLSHQGRLASGRQQRRVAHLLVRRGERHQRVGRVQSEACGVQQYFLSWRGHGGGDITKAAGGCVAQAGGCAVRAEIYEGSIAGSCVDMARKNAVSIRTIK